MSSAENGANNRLVIPEDRQRNASGSTVKSHHTAITTTSLLTLPPPPPDGGWGWVVVAASFIAHMLADGCAFSYGILYTELLISFEESKAKTAMIGSLYLAMPLMMGPVSSALTDRFGCRSVSMCGGIITGIAFIASSFANSIEMLLFTLGVCAGFGLSLIYVPAVVIVAFYFEKRRAFATGIAVAGTGIGTFIFAPLFKGLITEYGWRGTLLILGAIFFNVIACGMVFRPLTYPKRDRKRRRYEANLAKFSKLNSTVTVNGNDTVYYSGGTELETVNKTITQDASLDAIMSQTGTQSLMHFPSFVAQELTTLYPNLLEDLAKEKKTLREVLTENGLHDRFFTIYSSLSNINTGPEVHQLSLKPDALFILDQMTSQLDTVSVQDHVTSQLDTVSFQDHVTSQLDAVSIQEHATSLMDALSDHVQDAVSVQEHVTFDIQPTQIGSQDYRMSMEEPTVTSSDPIAKHRSIKKPVKKQCGSAKTARHNRPYSIRGTGMAANRQMVPMYRKDVFYRGNLMRPGLLATKHHHKSVSCPNIAMRIRDDSSSESSSEGWSQAQCTVCLRNTHNSVKNMIDFGVLRSTTFIYFCTSTFLLYFAYDVPYVFSADRAVNLGVSEAEASFLVSIIGITSTVGQILLGWIGDLPKMNTIILYSSLTLSAGIFTICVPRLHTYPLMCLYSASFGFFISANYALTTIILVDLLGMGKLTNAYGIVMLSNGIGNLIGPVIAGYLSDVTDDNGEYKWPFIMAGIIISISGSMLFATPCIQSRDKVAKEWADEMLSSDEETSSSEEDDPDEPPKGQVNGKTKDAALVAI